MPRLEFIYLRQEDVVAAGVLDMKKAIEDVEKIFEMYARGEVVMPAKTVLDFKDEEGKFRGLVASMPCYAGGDLEVVGIKWAAEFLDNPAKRNMPFGVDLLVLSDPESGSPLAIMDGTLVTAVRTSAVTGIAVKHLAVESPRKIGVVGAGVIGRTTLMALSEVLRDPEEVGVYDIRREKAAKLAEEFADELPVKAAGSLEEVVKGRDVVITATTSSSRFVREDWIGPGCLCVQVGINEFSEKVVLKADKVVVDNWVQIKDYERSMLSELYRKGLLRDGSVLELPYIVAGEQPGRESSEELIFFDSFGMACEDLVVAYRIYKTALERGLGTRLALWEEPLWK